MTVQNEQIAESLERVAEFLELQDAKVFRVRAYRNAADTVRSEREPLAERVAREEDLTQLHDVGKAIAEKIEELVRTGRLAYLDQLAAETPAGLLDVLRVPGLGVKRVRLLHEALGIASVDDLRRAVDEGQIAALPGFGQKTEDRLRERLSPSPQSDSSRQSNRLP